MEPEDELDPRKTTKCSKASVYVLKLQSKVITRGAFITARIINTEVV